MDIMLTLTIRQLKQNKRQTVGVVIGIAAATFFLTLCLIFIYSGIDRLLTLEKAGENENIKELLQACAIILAIVLTSLTLFIYHVLSLSAARKQRQLGILGSVGATPFQRGKLMIYEAFILSIISIPLGTAIGIAVSYIVTPFPVVISWISIALMMVFETFVIVLVGILQTFFSIKGSVIGLLSNHTEKRNLSQNKQLPKWMKKCFRLEGQLAVKNLYFFRKRYLIIGLSFFLSMILFLDGFIYLNYLDGKYQPKDQRLRKYADFSVVEHSENGNNRNWDFFVAEIKEDDQIEDALICKQFSLGGVLFQKENIRADLKEFATYELTGEYKNPIVLKNKTQTCEEGYYMSVDLIGIDQKSFQRYAEDIGVAKSNLNQKELKNIPVIIDDTALITKGIHTEYQGFLDISPNAAINVTGTRERINYGQDASANEVSEFVSYQFEVLAVTQKPVFDQGNISNVLMAEPNRICFYTTVDYLEQFLDNYGFEQETENYVDIKIKNGVEFPNHMMFPAVIQKFSGMGKAYFGELKVEPEYLKSDKTENLYQLLQEQTKRIKPVESRVQEIGQKYGIACDLVEENSSGIQVTEGEYYIDSYLGWLDGALKNPYLIFRQLFTCAIMIFLIIICVFQMIKLIVSSISMRKREFAVLLSLGMDKRKIWKSVCMENIFSLFLAFLAGGISSMIIGASLFQSWTQTQALTPEFPYYIFFLEFLFFLMLIVLTLIISAWCMRKIEIADMLKDDTV